MYTKFSKDNKILRGGEFPREYRRLFKVSGLSVREIAKILNLKYRRLSDLLYNNHSAMDKKEYRLISEFCEIIKEEYEPETV